MLGTARPSPQGTNAAPEVATLARGTHGDPAELCPCLGFVLVTLGCAAVGFCQRMTLEWEMFLPLLPALRAARQSSAWGSGSKEGAGRGWWCWEGSLGGVL